jgi:hypothetical protein
MRTITATSIAARDGGNLLIALGESRKRIMGQEVSSRHRVFAVVAVVGVVAWSAAGFFDRRGDGWVDPLFEPDYTILFVPRGGTLDRAGFQVGDSVISVEDVPVVDLGMYSRWPRSLSRQPGESLTIVVEREGQLASGDIVFRAPSAANAKMALGAMVIVVSFLASGLWVLFTVGSVHAVRLGYLGLVLAAAVPGPYLGSWDGIASHWQVAVLVLWTLLLLRFFLHFPKPKRVGENHRITVLTYGAWVALILLLVLELMFHPRYYHTFAPLYGLLMLGYSLLAVAAVAHTLATTPRPELHASGTMIILVGVMVALVLTVIAGIDWMVLREFDIPGSHWLPVTVAVIPLTMALAVRKQARAGD